MLEPFKNRKMHHTSSGQARYVTNSEEVTAAGIIYFGLIMLRYKRKFSVASQVSFYTSQILLNLQLTE